jgi:hypothetical protein
MPGKVLPGMHKTRRGLWLIDVVSAVIIQARQKEGTRRKDLGAQTRCFHIHECAMFHSGEHLCQIHTIVFWKKTLILRLAKRGG